MSASPLQQLAQIVQPKPSEPRTTPSLKEAIADPIGTLDSYLVTPSLRAALREILDKAVHAKGQGYWVKAEYGAGKTHYLAALTTLLTQRDPAVWAALKDDTLQEYQAPLAKVKLFPVTFSLLGVAEADASDNLFRRFLKESKMPSRAS
jgi:chromosomal replication initiation ATPase DnaA